MRVTAPLLLLAVILPFSVNAKEAASDSKTEKEAPAAKEKDSADAKEAATSKETSKEKEASSSKDKEAAASVVNKRTAIAGKINRMGGYTPPACINGMSRSASLSVNFNGQEKSLADARGAIDSRRKNVESDAVKMGGDELKLTNYNYNVSMSNSYNNDAQVQAFSYSGSLNYQINDEDIAKRIADHLAQVKQPFSMSVNASACQQQSSGMLE